MSWQDRPYYRDNPSASGRSIMWLFAGSLPLFTVFGIRVRLHASMLILVVLTLIFASAKGGLGVHNAVTSMSLLFISVLAHEFGHCFAARGFGGEANDIVMWPLGGLAYADPPHRPWPSFFTTAAGPGVNWVICLITGALLVILGHSIKAVPWFPFTKPLLSLVPQGTVEYYIWWLFLINYSLLTFNLLLLFYPFDGGRMVQELLWVKLGYVRSMRIATVIGMVAAVLVAMVAVALWSLMLILLAGMGFYGCYQQRQLLKETAMEIGDEEITDFSAAYELEPAPRRRKIGKRAIRRAMLLAKEAALESARVDAILAKVSANGMASLTWGERRALRKATAHRRKLDQQGLIIETQPGRQY